MARNTMKRTCFFLPLLLTCFLFFTGCGTASTDPASSPSASVLPSAPSSQASSPLLWKIEDASTGGVLYLFGSIHVGSDSLYPLPDAVMHAYESCDALAVECNINSMQADDALQYTSYFSYEEGDSITNHLSPETYEALEAFLTEQSNYGTALPLLQSYNPAFWSSLIDQVILEQTELDSALGLDRYFLSLAQEEKKEILEIESLDFQFQLLANVPDRLQEYFITSSITAPEEETASLQALYEAVRTGSEDTLNTLLFEEADLSQDEDLTPEEQELLSPMMEEYTKMMYSDRNTHMTETAKTYLKEGRCVFFVVGMAHVLGEDGILSQLEASGYTPISIQTGT